MNKELVIQVFTRMAPKPGPIVSRGAMGVMGREEPRTGGVGMDSGILPKQFGRSYLPDGVEVLGGSESQTSPSQKAAERLKPLWSSPDEWNDDNRHLPYMSEATREQA